MMEGRAREVPGSVGWMGISDKTLEFAYNPQEFIKNKIKQYQSPVFKARMLNKPTVFLTTSKAVQQLLEDSEQCFEMGYKDLGYMHSLFGDLVIFINDDGNVSRLRGIFHSLFTPQTMNTITDTVSSACDHLFSMWETDQPVAVYDQFKHFTTELCLNLFLGVNGQTCEDEMEMVRALTRTHWHGLISIPISLKIGNYFTSSYGRAIAAKNSLLTVIKERLPHNENTLLEVMKGAEFQDVDELSRHVLLFVSALIPKALSSLLTSCCLELAKPCNVKRRERAVTDDDYLKDVLLETKRLWPPFLGGRRIAKKRVIIDGYEIQKGCSVAYLMRNANTDPSVFPEPEKFHPERWQSTDAPSRSRVFTFGQGRRSCIGEHCIGRILHVITKRLLMEYTWEVEPNEDLTYKWLPVSRPKHNVKVKFTKRERID